MLIRELLTERLHPFELDEDVPIRSIFHLGAFAITVAEAYDAAPENDPTVAPLWHALARQNDQVILRKIASSGIKVVYSPDDLYSSTTDDPRMMVRYMLWDMVMNQRLVIYTGHSDHPAFTPEDNVIFRTVHDYFTHGKLRSVFRKQVEVMGLANKKPSPEELAKILPTIRLDKTGNIGHAFSLRGEINAYLTHSKIALPKTLPVLFTEIIGQASYQNVVGDFPQQKVAVLRGFDFRRIGLGEHESHPVQRRMDELTQQLGSSQTVETHIAAKPKVIAAQLLAAIGR